VANETQRTKEWQAVNPVRNGEKRVVRETRSRGRESSAAERN